MFHKGKILQLTIALALVAMQLFSGILLPNTAPAALAQSGAVDITGSAPPYVTPGSNITYAYTLKNLTGQQLTNFAVFHKLPANTTYVSGGVFNAGQNRAEFVFSSLAVNETRTYALVVKVGSGVAIGTVITVNSSTDYSYAADQAVGISHPIGFGTTVERPGTRGASLKNASGRAFDVAVDGFGFQNYTNAGPLNANDDLGPDDMFALFGPAACEFVFEDSCLFLTAPAQQWMENQIAFMNGGHCDGFSVAGLRFFEQLPFQGKTTPADFQAGAANTTALTFPDQPIENYIAYSWTTQQMPEVYTKKIAGAPNTLVSKLATDFNRTPSISYAIHIFKLPGWQGGHSITPYGLESVPGSSPAEVRILVYDNNYPKQRQYITVNTVANTWKYVTASTPGQPLNVYEGTATSGNLLLVPNSLREVPAGYFACPFCSDPASVQAAADGQITGEISFQFSGEGAIVVENDEGQKTGIDIGSDTLVEEIPNAELIHFNGGLGKEIPPRITVPFTEHDETFYTVVVHGTTVTTPTHGSLSIVGPGFHLGVDNIELDANEVFTFTVSPDGDHISFVSSETEVAPPIHIAHDPVADGNPSVIFEVSGEELFAGERIALDLDPVLERIEIDDTGLEEEDFLVTMDLIFPDGDVHVFTDTVIIPAGVISAEVDFGAWDGLLTPPLYLENVLQNPSVNHRLMLQRASGVYDATPQANAPAGVYHVDATFVNVTEIQLTDLHFTVADLAAGNVLLNADGSPAGAGAKLLVPNTALGDDGLLHVNESVTVRFSIGLTSADTSAVTINANGVPHDWTHEAPPLAGEANNASFVFTVRTDNPLYLPLVAR